MEQILQSLGGILLKAVPTVVLLILLLFYLKAMLYGPLEKVLKQRSLLTEGARKAAHDSLAAAERKQLEYEANFRDARSEVYRAQEETRRVWLNDQNAQIAQARERADASLKAAKDRIAAETSTARQGLMESSSALADQIATTVLSRKARA